MSLVCYRLQELEWDTNFFGVKMGEIQLELKSDGSNFSETALRRTMEVARKRNFHFLLCQFDTSHQEISHVLTNNGAAIGDVLVTLALDLSKIPPVPSSPKYEVIKAVYTDLPEIVQIASESFRKYSRFYQDARFDADKVSQFYPSWVAESFMTDGKTYVIKEQNKVVGFIALQMKPGEKTVIITLIAIDISRRGHGLGQALIEWVIAYAVEQGMTRIQVGTQINNLPAVRLYEKNGFQLISAKYRFHIWLGPVGKLQQISKGYNESAVGRVHSKNT